MSSDCIQGKASEVASPRLFSFVVTFSVYPLFKYVDKNLLCNRKNKRYEFLHTSPPFPLPDWAVTTLTLYHKKRQRKRHADGHVCVSFLFCHTQPIG